MNIPKRINSFTDDDELVVMHHSGMDLLVDAVRDHLDATIYAGPRKTDAEIMTAIRKVETESGLLDTKGHLERVFVEQVISDLQDAKGAAAGE